MARYNILTVNLPDKLINQFQKLLGKDFEFLNFDNLPSEKKIHLALVHETTNKLCETIMDLQSHKDLFKTPIFLVGNLKDENKILKCFNTGLDDFINENWSKELIKAKLLAFFNCRKKFKKDSSRKIRIGNVTINPKKRKVTRKGEEVSLTKIEYDILNLLANDSGKIFSREEIYDHIWGRQVIVGERTLDVHMNNLRKKIGKSKIQTKKGIGFGINPNL
ncbi:MAG TPA: response regulator transcription factor [Flavobacteriia bacterium]|jgi:two-component system alkaline phosphatase synthesis response regulator PhoP|nr:response regulator transcription factor [Flavobacteriia bacterium]